MPASRAWAGDGLPTSCPSITYSPASRRIAPVRILISVLLPAPFSPARHMTSPARSSSVTPCSALIGPYVLAAPRSETTRLGAGSVGWTGGSVVIVLMSAGLRGGRVEQRLDHGGVHVLGV